MYPLKKFAGIVLGTSGYKEKRRRLHLEYLRVEGKKCFLSSIL
ncbi:hypothetical protein Goklo_011998 [Gossypium klotzschianum]|uniref:Uncharacterized protein n=1 Tax=Gossypium klotzschianum TaxID=34286 RepID=A0A7J8VAS8_9ROSI|nr:hypothetical protein [Gossypium klotzschianum]